MTDVEVSLGAATGWRPSKRERPEPKARVSRATARRWRRIAAQWDAMQVEIEEAVLRA